MTGDDPADRSADGNWVAYILAALFAFEFTILVVSLIWL